MAEQSSEQNIVEHLGELRKRLIWVLLVFIAAFAFGMIYAEPIVEHLKNDPAARDIPWNVFALGDALRVYLQFAFVIALVITTPFAMLQMWQFVKPGLKPNEQKATLIYIPTAFLLFIIGILFGYYWIFPFIVQFMSGFSERLGVQEMYGISQYFGFMFRLVLPIAIVFQLPVIVMFLTRIRILTPHILKKSRRYAYVLLVLVAALITPPDFVSNILVAIPLIVLYEVSVWLSGRVYRKVQAQDAQWE